MFQFDFISLLIAFSIVLGSLACVLIYINLYKFKLANSLLLVHLVAMCLLGIMNFLNHSGLIVKVPLLFRFPSFTFYLIAPCAYLYVKTVLKDSEKLEKWDYLNFVPALLHFLEMIPYHLKPLAAKQEIIARSIANPELLYALNEGMLPPYWHHIIRTGLAIGYSISMLRMISQYLKINKWAYNVSKETYNWLFFYSSVFLCVVSVVFWAKLLEYFSGLPFFSIYIGSICVLFMVLLYYLFFHPEILYGAPRLYAKPEPLSVLIPEEKNQSETDYEHLIIHQEDLEMYMQEQQPFLQQGFSIRDMSEATGISQHHLSALMNKIYGVRFNDFVNKYRLDFLIENRTNSEHQKLSVDGLAKSAGFGSRVSLFNALKKLKGITPSEFFKQEKSETPEL